MKLKNGLRVEIKCEFNRGWVGSICYVNGNQVGVEFKNWEGGHRCGGYSKTNTGWHFDIKSVELTNRPLVDYSDKY